MMSSEPNEAYQIETRPPNLGGLLLRVSGEDRTTVGWEAGRGLAAVPGGYGSGREEPEWMDVSANRLFLG